MVCNKPVLGDQVVHETLDGETVVINLATGNYFSLEGSAADLWSRLLAGETAGESGAELAALHGGGAGAITAEIVLFHWRLYEQGLLAAEPPVHIADTGSLGTFDKPHLHVYDDLQAHLLADPVHDVERGEGWPALAPES